MESRMEAPQKTKMELPYDPAIPLLGIYFKEYVRLKQRHLYLFWFQS
jgi:hypothetical protein